MNLAAGELEYWGLSALHLGELHRHLALTTILPLRTLLCLHSPEGQLAPPHSGPWHRQGRGGGVHHN